MDMSFKDSVPTLSLPLSPWLFPSVSTQQTTLFSVCYSEQLCSLACTRAVVTILDWIHTYSLNTNCYL